MRRVTAITVVLTISYKGDLRRSGRYRADQGRLDSVALPARLLSPALLPSTTPLIRPDVSCMARGWTQWYE